MKIESVRREFSYNGVSLADPDADMSPEDVRDVYSATYGELTTAEVIDHGIENSTHRYEFRKQVGTKG